MNKKIFFLFLFFLLLSFHPPSAEAGLSTYSGHSGVSVSSALSLTEESAVKFGNFSVSSPGGGDAYIVLDINGGRTGHNGASTTIALMNGGYSDAGAQEAGHYRVANAGASATLYVSFTDPAGAAISSGNPVILTGPVGSDEFYVDSFTFNSDGTDATGDYILAGSTGAATIHVGATLHTKAGAGAYMPGTYRGTFSIMVSY